MWIQNTGLVIDNSSEEGLLRYTDLNCSRRWIVGALPHMRPTPFHHPESNCDAPHGRVCSWPDWHRICSWFHESSHPVHTIPLLSLPYCWWSCMFGCLDDTLLINISFSLLYLFSFLFILHSSFSILHSSSFILLPSQIAYRVSSIVNQWSVEETIKAWLLMAPPLSAMFPVKLLPTICAMPNQISMAPPVGGLD